MLFRVDDINGEVRRLEMAAKQKEERYITLEKRYRAFIFNILFQHLFLYLLSFQLFSSYQNE